MHRCFADRTQGPYASLGCPGALAARNLGELAALRCKETSDHVPLHVSLVGQGAFKNPRAVMSRSFSHLLSALRGFDVAVYFHGYGDEDVKIILGVLKELGENNIEVKPFRDFFEA